MKRVDLTKQKECNVFALTGVRVLLKYKKIFNGSSTTDIFFTALQTKNQKIRAKKEQAVLLFFKGKNKS